MRKYVMPLLAALLAAAATAGVAIADHHRDNDVNWLKVTVDPRSREVCSFQPEIVPANRTAVPPA